MRRTLVHHCRQQSVGAHCCWGKRSTQVFASSTSIATAFDFDGCKKIINKEPRKGKECPPGSPQYSVVVPCPYNIGSINALKSIPFQALTGHQSTISPLNSYFIGSAWGMRRTWWATSHVLNGYDDDDDDEDECPIKIFNSLPLSTTLPKRGAT